MTNSNTLLVSAVCVCLLTLFTWTNDIIVMLYITLLSFLHNHNVHILTQISVVLQNVVSLIVRYDMEHLIIVAFVLFFLSSFLNIITHCRYVWLVMCAQKLLMKFLLFSHPWRYGMKYFVFLSFKSLMEAGYGFIFQFFLIM